ncbi:hypothetical protein [Paenibacillus cookii]|uniref:Beta-galactosidase trimerisation domain-containing protein n=1 Tax=Paenibacillus cookii TaxID=157839 RepID=A0ABQ4LRR7_9BACL|nr:hypothetical protein [Paenibacillus cookii]GIO65848.1 hypothetical protein J21TS3_06690 [Paenibacillus cookii]
MVKRSAKAAPEWTGFQEARPYGPKYDLRTDFVMVYGISDDLPERIAGWKQAGYTVHLMTGVAWGDYQDYLYGRFDGRNHWDEAQTDRAGKHLLHNVDVPYMVPTVSFADYLSTHIKKAIDAGVEAIHMEEPEFWAAAGYSEAFKREWLNVYGEEWIPPHASHDAQYRASKLKAAMYYRAMDRICSAMKEYALATYGRTVRFYIPTHSLINYAQWRIVSPEALFVSMPACDGFIAQIWTGTSRTPNVYRGVRRERTFETAYMEYGMMQELTRGTGREMWFLHDPIEDNPRHTWADYEQNYLATVTASLLHPGVSQYEVCPWPRRVFEGTYPKEDGTGKEPIPGRYATKLLSVMHMLGEMHRYPADAAERPGTGIGLCLANSAMFQRGSVDASPDGQEVSNSRYDGTETDDPLSMEERKLLDWSPFYGLALPLLKFGVPVRPLQYDNLLHFPGYLDEYKVLFLSYEFMKPEHPGIHQVLAQWIRGGGVLIYVGDGSDPYHRVREWWNRETRRGAYERPEEHLFETLGLGRRPKEGLHPAGAGAVVVRRKHPAAFAETAEGADSVLDSLREALAFRGEEAEFKENRLLDIQRGPYRIAHLLDETGCADPVVLEGSFIRLFDDRLSLATRVELMPNGNVLLYDLDYDAGNQGQARILAASSRTRKEIQSERGLHWMAESPEGIRVSTRAWVPHPPRRASVDGEDVTFDYDAETQTVFLEFEGSPQGKNVQIEWA